MTDPLDVLREEVVRFAADLIRIESVNTGDPATIGDGEARCCAYLRERLEEVGYECFYAEAVPGRGNLVTRLPGGSPDALVLHAHVDVVPARAEDWSIPPFAGRIHDGHLYGRGAVDMKNMVAMVLAVARHLRREGIVPVRDLIFAFFSDEEAQGRFGAAWMVDTHPEVFADATEALGEVGGCSVTVSDAQGRLRRLYPLAVGEKGVAWATLRARGRAGHGSLPAGDNAVATIARAVAAIADHPFPATAEPCVAACAVALGEVFGEPIAVADLDGMGERLGPLGQILAAGRRTTASPTVLRAGYKTNVIPAEAVAEVDCRVVPGGEDELRETLGRLAGPDVEIEWVWESPIAAPPTGPVVDRVVEAMRAHDPEGIVVPYLLHASTDNKHLARLGIAGYGFVPLRVAPEVDVFGLFHAVDERVAVDALHFGVAVLADIAAGR